MIRDRQTRRPGPKIYSSFLSGVRKNSGCERSSPMTRALFQTPDRSSRSCRGFGARSSQHFISALIHLPSKYYTRLIQTCLDVFTALAFVGYRPGRLRTNTALETGLLVSARMRSQTHQIDIVWYAHTLSHCEPHVTPSRALHETRYPLVLFLLNLNLIRDR